MNFRSRRHATERCQVRFLTLAYFAVVLTSIGCGSDNVSISSSPTVVTGIPQLVSALDDDNDVTVKQAADALAALGPEAHEAVPELIQALRYHTGENVITVKFNGQEVPYKQSDD